MRLETGHGPRDIVVIACDLDRTLTDSKLRVVPLALKRLQQLRSRGAHAVLLSGRSARELLRRRTLLQHFDRIVAESGALLGQSSTFKSVARTGPAWSRFRAWLDNARIPHRPGQASISMSARHAPKLSRHARRLGIAVHRNRERIDVTPAECDKGTGLQEALRSLGVPASGCLVFGDAENDLAAFRQAGYCVAVGNARPIVKRAADEVAPGYGGRAVSNFLYRRFLGGETT